MKSDILNIKISKKINIVISNCINNHIKLTCLEALSEYANDILNIKIDIPEDIDLCNFIINTYKIFTDKENSILIDYIKSILASLSTDYSSNSNIKPTDISFDDYKKLTYEALETIFNGDSEKIGTASGLLGTAKLTNDDILNKIYFDNKSESIKNNTSDKYFQTLGMIAIMNFKLIPKDISLADKSAFLELIARLLDSLKMGHPLMVTFKLFLATIFLTICNC